MARLSTKIKTDKLLNISKNKEVMKLKKSCVLSVSFLLCCMALSAQNPDFRPCGHDLLLESLESSYPGYRARVNQYFDYIQSEIRNQAFRIKADEVLRIPVVIHIVWKNEEENLSDEIIQAQMDVLNEDFRLLNPNKDSLRQLFRDRQSDVGIEFDLVMVKRIKTTSNFNLSLTGLVDNVKRPANGGSRAEDTQKFLNIWVCKIQPIPFIGGQILGYAYPPAGLANWPANASAPSPDLEGVVIDYRAFGKNNPYPITLGSRTLYSEGRTATHEIGHYLGLRHIWGDGALFGGSSCNEDDGIDDTPNQGRQSQYDCEKAQNTCTDTMDDEPDMIENYMDYSDQLCQCAFTEGQAAHMRMVVLTKRAGLVRTQDDALSNGNESYHIYPIPFSDVFFLKATHPNNSKQARIQVTDQTGRTIKNMHTDPGVHSPIDMTDFPDGIYYINIITQDGVISRKLVKQSR
jgi:hypothetical protein